MGLLNQLSPGIAISEIDLTGIIPAVSTSVGAFVGQFNWGPVGEPLQISDENDLIAMFGKPSATASTDAVFTAQCFLCAASFLAYTNNLYLVRTANSSAARNACANTANTTLYIANREDYENRYVTGSANGYGAFAAKYPGTMGNSLKVSVCANNAAFSTWTYRDYFENAPGTSSFVSSKYNNFVANDEMHIIVFDSLGEFTGRANTVLERFAFLSKAVDAIDNNGRNAYYREHLNQNSSYVYALDPPDYTNTNGTWGQSANSTIVYNSPPNYTSTLTGGNNGGLVTDGQLVSNWYLFKDRDRYEISLAFAGPASANVASNVLDNLILGSESETPTLGRKDTMLFVSPRSSDVINQSGLELANMITGAGNWLSVLNRSSSYLVADSGWKYMLDRYNNIYRWVPLNADIAGLCAYTDSVADPWWSPGGYNRGKLKNVVKLAWSPDLSSRDTLYKNGINPVITQRGEGVILLGDKTMQAKPSAFDRINVRRLFITLEKAISRAARYTLFEFNDPFTRAQFVAMVEPYLRTVKGRRGIIDFKVICDESNNTGDIIDRNAFVGDIYIKPSRSINFIQLNFVAVKSSVEFSTVIGQW